MRLRCSRKRIVFSGYSGYIPAKTLEYDRVPSSIGRRPVPGSNLVQMGMDKMRGEHRIVSYLYPLAVLDLSVGLTEVDWLLYPAFRSIQGYTGHVPNRYSPLRGGKGINSQTRLNIVTALGSLLHDGVDIGVIARALDRTKGG